MKKTVGRFTLDSDGTLTAPSQYMHEQGDKLIESILAGNDVIFNMTGHLSPDVETAILVRLQTDFAGWLGIKEAESWLKKGA